MDADLKAMSREQLQSEAQKLRDGIRAHLEGSIRYRASLDAQAPEAPRTKERFEK